MHTKFNDDNFEKEADLLFKDNYHYFDSKLKELNIEASLDSFLVTTKIFWTIISTLSGERWRYDRASGDFLNLGNGDWIIFGTCFGTYPTGAPSSSSWGIEYNSNDDSLIWSIGMETKKYTLVSNLNSPVQMKKDISGKPQLIVVRADNLMFGAFTKIVRGSYITFT